MLRQNKKAVVRQTSLFLITVLAATVIWPGCSKKEPAGQVQPEQSPDAPAKQSANVTNSSKSTLNDIIRTATGWGPIHQSWYGKHAPDFTLTDITGKKHKLSDYRGKDVMIIFWATWCPPCRMEIPHLIELRETTGQDKLAMLAITNENQERVKDFVDRNRMNYTVLLDTGRLPRPYNKINAIPASFFIDPQGRIKLATEGMMSLPHIQAILKAEPDY